MSHATHEHCLSSIFTPYQELNVNFSNDPLKGGECLSGCSCFGGRDGVPVAPFPRRNDSCANKT